MACATCGVRLFDTDHDPVHRHDGLADRVGNPRLSCQICVSTDLTVHIPEKRVWGGRSSDESPKSGPGESQDVSEGYRTVASRGQARFEIQGSAFIGHVTPVESVDAAEAFVDAISTEYDDATHNVPAYRVRAEPFREYASDADEPAGSAGKPALNVLQQEDIENVAAVVTRYYGGTKLGVGGLARAYSRGVKAAVEDAGIVEEQPHERFTVTVEYDDSGTVRGILESSGVDFEAEYETAVAFAVRVPEVEASELRDRLRSATSGRASFETE